MEYVRTLCVVCLFWTQWHNKVLTACYSQEMCETLLSRLSAALQRDPAAKILEEAFDVFLNVGPACTDEKDIQGSKVSPVVCTVFLELQVSKEKLAASKLKR